MKNRILNILFLFILIPDAFSQESFLSRLFFPVTFGISFPLEDADKTGRFITSEGIEYRLKTKLPLFTRISLDNLSLNYSISSQAATNVLKSKYDAAIVTLGGGIRSTKGALRVSGLAQAGVMNYKFPIVSLLPPGYEVIYRHRNQVAFGLVGSVEYYFVRDFAAVIEGHFMYSPFPGTFWGKDFHYAGFRLGITAVLF
jgi:hypothetical protein